MRTIRILMGMVAFCAAMPAASQQHKARGQAAMPAGKPEPLRVAAISLTDEDGTVLTLKDAAGAKLEPTKVPLTICRKDHLGRLLPGMDVKVAVETRTVAGKPVRFVRPERFREWCN